MSTEKVTIVLSPAKVVRRKSINHYECLACGAEGKLLHRLGTLWEVGIEEGRAAKGFLAHHWFCPMNRILLRQNKKLTHFHTNQQKIKNKLDVGDENE